MCSENAGIDYIITHSIVNQELKCRKCNIKPCFKLALKEYICSLCFDEMILHKFKTALGKFSNVFNNNENVVIFYSNDRFNRTLSELLFQCHQNYSGGKLNIKINIIFSRDLLFLNGYSNENITVLLEEFKVISSKYQFISHILDSFVYLSKEFVDFWIKKTGLLIEFSKYLKRNIMFNIAKSLSINKILLNDDSDQIASNILSSFSHGKPNEMSYYMDSNFKCDSINILKPLRYMQTKEIVYYCYKMKFESIYFTVNKISSSKLSIDDITSQLIVNLLPSFNSTISSICNVSQKIMLLKSDYDINCQMCLCLFSKEESDERKLCKHCYEIFAVLKQNNIEYFGKTFPC